MAEGSETRLWIVTPAEESRQTGGGPVGPDYDEFESAVVWADSADDARRVLREAHAQGDLEADVSAPGRYVHPEWELNVVEAPRSGVVHATVEQG